MNRSLINSGCDHKPHTRFVKLTNTTYCLRCAPPLASEIYVIDENKPKHSLITQSNTIVLTRNHHITNLSSANNTVVPPPLTSVSITEMLRDAEAQLRSLDKSRRLALCCLAEELTIKDLEEIRTNAKAKVDETMLGILRRLESVQRRLHSDVDKVIDSRLSKYSRVRTLIDECDRISREVSEPLSWRGSYDNTASIVASLQLEQMMISMKNNSASSSSSTPQQQHQSTISSSSSAAASIPDEMQALLQDLHKTLDIEIESRTKRFALDENDLVISIREGELEMPFDEFAAATERSMQKKNKYDYQDRDLGGREGDFDEETDRIQTLRRFEPKHSAITTANSSFADHVLTSRNSRSELLGRNEKIRAEQEKLRNEFYREFSPSKFGVGGGVKKL